MRGDDKHAAPAVEPPATSAGVARSATTSTAGGSEVRDAAARSTVTPSPNSTST